MIHRRNQDIRVLWIHHDIGTAREVIDKQNALPGLTAIRRLVDATLFISAPETAHCRYIEDIRVRRMYDNTPDVLGLLKTDMGKGIATIRGLIHPVAPARALAVVGLTGTDIEDIRMALTYREVADAAGFEVLKNGLEGGSIVDGLEDATGCRRNVVGVWICVYNSKVIDTATHDCWADCAPWQVFRKLDLSLRRCGCVDTDACKGDCGEDNRALGLHV